MFAAIILAFLFMVGGCRRSAPQEERFAVMGTFASVMAGADESDRTLEYAHICAEIMREIESQLSLYRKDSELSRLNARAGMGPVRVGGHLRANLEMALRFGELSGGAFDVTVGPLVKMWGFSGGTTPTEWVPAERIEETRRRVGYRRIRLQGDQVSLEGTNMVVDLGGIAKGYAVDVCCDELRRRGARNFVVNLGGNMRCFGRPEASRSWQIGVQNPFRPHEVIGRVDLGDGVAVATSGNYERFVMIRDRRCAHIIDPRTGLPVEGMAGVTVLAATAAEADALSTSLFVLGLGEGGKVAAEITNGAAVFVPDRQPMEVWITPSMTNIFRAGAGVVPRLKSDR
jgi:thiamine biosynthesis lipoprotein